MDRSRTRQPDMLRGPVFSNMMRFFVPIMLGTLLQQLYSIVDAIILGRYAGKTALAAVGGSDYFIISLIVGFFVGFASGASVVVSQCCGAGERGDAQKAVHTAMLLAVLIGAVMTALGIVSAPWFLSALDTPQELLHDSSVYIVWYYAGMIPMMVYNMGAGILRATGDSRRPLLFLVVCAAANTALDFLLVAVIPLGAAGAAIATSLSQLICAALVAVTLLRETGLCRLEPRLLRISGNHLRRIVVIGLPMGLASTMYSFTNLFVQKATNLLGTDAVAAWSVFWKLDGVFWPVSNAIGIAVSTFVGQNYGARNRARIRTCIRVGLVMHLGFSALYSAALYLTRTRTVPIFSTDPNVIREGVLITSYLALTYPLFSFTEVLSSGMRGTGNAVMPTVLTLFGICFARLAILHFVTFPHLSDFTVAICFPATWAVSSLMFLLYYKFGRWMPEYPSGG